MYLGQRVLIPIVIFLTFVPKTAKSENGELHLMLGLFSSVVGHKIAEEKLGIENRNLRMVIAVSAGMAPNATPAPRRRWTV